MNRWLTDYPTVHWITLDPVIARQLLAMRQAWRVDKVQLELVDCYAQQMRDGQWSFTGDTLKVSKSGHFIDGQHRCLATIAAGWSGTQLVVTGIADVAELAMDQPGRAA